MRIGFTGTQKGMTIFQAEELAKRLEDCTEFIFGDCIGSDIEAADIAFGVGVRIFTVYPQNKNTRKRAWFYNPDKDITRENGRDYFLYPSGARVKWMPAMEPLEKNKQIVNACDRLIATPKEFTHTLRSGTWATIRYAWKTKKDVTIIPPIERED